jgi:methionyl-tRNA formyltransferase
VTAPARTVFLGTGHFAVPVAQALHDAPEVDVIAVVTAGPRPSGRGLALRPSAVGEWAAEHGIDPFTPPRLRDPIALAWLTDRRPDLLVLADYGRLVPPAWLDVPPHGALNVHPSLLPRHRGATPVPAAILAGDPETGVSLMRMDQGLDTGPIIAQWRVPLLGDEIANELEARLAEDGARLLANSLEGWLSGTLPAIAQPADGATLTRPLRREDGRLDPLRPAEALERQVRAYQPWPGAFLEADGDRLAVLRAAALPAAPDGAEPGLLVHLPSGGLGLGTARGTLDLLQVQRAGGRPMSGADFLRGQPGWIGRHVGADSRP